MEEFIFKAPCKIGQKIYTIPNFEMVGLNKIYNIDNNRVSERNVDRIIFEKDGYYITSYIETMPVYCLFGEKKEHSDNDKFYGKTWFLTYQEAKEKLDEYIQKWDTNKK